MDDSTIITNTDIILDDGTKLNIDISHFQPKSDNEIEQNILTRIECEEFKIYLRNNPPDPNISNDPPPDPNMDPQNNTDV